MYAPNVRIQKSAILTAEAMLAKKLRLVNEAIRDIALLDGRATENCNDPYVAAAYLRSLLAECGREEGVMIVVNRAGSALAGLEKFLSENRS
jgi:hypothetical protein